MLSDPFKLIENVRNFFQTVTAAGIETEPLLIWEPLPSSCDPENIEGFREAVRSVHVFSPNHIELGALFGHGDSCLTKAIVESYTNMLAHQGLLAKRFTVVRAGEEGCFIMSSGEDERSFWAPPYFEKDGDELDVHVVDPTGAGNTFLGAFAIGLLRTGDIREAASYGAVGASFALQQTGFPEKSVGICAEERWNGDRVIDRLRRYQSRSSIGPSRDDF